MYVNRHNILFGIIGIIVLLMAQGCSGAAHFIYNELCINRNLSDKDIHAEDTYVLDVPFIEQKDTECCGLVALGMVIKYWNETNEPMAFINDIECPEGGFSGKELKKIAFSRGFDSHIFRGNLPLLFQHLLATRPIIILLCRYVSYHYVVVSGYSENGRFIVDDPSRGKRFIAIEDLMRQWEKASYFSMILIPKHNREISEEKYR